MPKLNKIVFATNNAHKLDEIRSIAGESLEVLSLSDIGCHADIPENENTLEKRSMDSKKIGISDACDKIYACVKELVK